MKVKIFLLSAVLLLFASCQELNILYYMDSGSYTTFDLDRVLVSESEYNGNLNIVNKNYKRFYLYVNDSIYRLIPANVDSFFVRINTSLGQSTNLKLYVATDLDEDELYQPPESKIYVQWQVILPPLTDDLFARQEYVKWVVPDEPGENTEAVITFKYPSVDDEGNQVEENVDIFLNSATGAKLLSLAPGYEVDRKIEYGYQILYFRYWVSDPNSQDGQKEIGWVTKKPNGTPYSLVLNYSNQDLSFNVPIYFEQYPDQYGYLELVNNTDNTLFIKANSQPLEDFIVVPTGESTQGMSYIGPQSTVIYKVPTGDYNLLATIPETGESVTSTQLTIASNDTLSFVIN